MKIVCLDLEGVLIPEIWIAFSQAAGIKELSRTTRDEPDYDKLMTFRLDILARNGFKLPDIQKVIAGMTPLPGAVEFTAALRAKTQLIILSDTFEQFAAPLMKQLGYPALFCNTLITGADGTVLSWKLRQKNGKKEAVKALKSCNFSIFAAGDSFNDLAMIEEADSGCLFNAPESIIKAYPHIPHVENYSALTARIDNFLALDDETARRTKSV
ncbi:MAG: bifunctional phosphoserine phosphatase/homoserine phosphotransferase ThrH [Spirochaetaceae bacterium]|jgi:phosphoserine/homoserine phosphotransferase|nr:bifunctional phosphoserine phosphatase/homoserine phosphotransferase ThrH [Spirochaetaceae bacterium]